MNQSLQPGQIHECPGEPVFAIKKDRIPLQTENEPITFHAMDIEKRTDKIEIPDSEELSSKEMHYNVIGFYFENDGTTVIDCELACFPDAHKYYVIKANRAA